MKKNVFVNISNHMSNRWSDDQRNAALELAETITDVQFPNVPPTDTTAEVEALAEDVVAKIPANAVALVQGEMTLVAALVRLLQQRGITVVASTTERIAVEEALPDGSVAKRSVFQFVQFRAYPSLI